MRQVAAADSHCRERGRSCQCKMSVAAGSHGRFSGGLHCSSAGIFSIRVKWVRTP